MLWRWWRCSGASATWRAPGPETICTELRTIHHRHSRRPADALASKGQTRANGAARRPRQRACGHRRWSPPRRTQAAFATPDACTHLQRHARRLCAVEINSSFYRPHQRATYARWAEGTPATFRFSVKLPRAITHAARLARCDALLKAFVEQVQGLGPRLGCLFMQLAPSLAMAPSRWSPGTPARSGEEMLAMVTPWQLAVLKVVATPVKLGLLTRSPLYFGAHTFHTSLRKIYI